MRIFTFLFLLIGLNSIFAENYRNYERLELSEPKVIAPLFTPPQQRFALIIGNSKYQKTLKNTINDAEAMASKLTALGFSVSIKTEANQARINNAINQFIQQLADAEDNAVGLFYYAGHGIEHNNVNYLIPVDEKIANPRDLVKKGVKLETVLKGFARLKHSEGNYFMILDACRNNPLGQNGWGKPQNRNYSIKNISWLFGAGYGQRAADNNRGKNGLFTSALLKKLNTKGATAEQIFKTVINAVSESSNDKQTPVMGGSPTHDFMFYPGKRVMIINKKGFSKHWLPLIMLIIAALLIATFYFFKQHRKVAWAMGLNPEDFTIEPQAEKEAIKKSRLASNEIKGYIKDMKSKKVIGVIPANYPVTLGRNQDNNIVIDREEVSGQHLNIGWDKKKQQFWIQDLNSTNGTWWDKNEPISQIKHPLEEKQSFYLIDQYSHYAVIKR